MEELGAESKTFLPHTVAASQRCIALPLFGAMTDAQVTEVCVAVRESLSEISANPDHFTDDEEIRSSECANAPQLWAPISL